MSRLGRSICGASRAVHGTHERAAPGSRRESVRARAPRLLLMPGSGAGGLRRTMSRRFAVPRSKPLINMPAGFLASETQHGASG